MTPDELRALSIAAAEAVGVEPGVRGSPVNPFYSGVTWLHEDSARCFELQAEHDLAVEFGVTRIGRAVIVKSGKWWTYEYYSDHNNDKLLATRVAILRALVAMKEKA